MNLRIVRVLFVCLSSLLAMILANYVLLTPKTPSPEAYTIVVLSLVTGFLLAIGFVGFEIILSRRIASLLPSIIVGIVLGVLTASLANDFLVFFDWYRGSAVSEVSLIFFSWLFIYMWSLFIIQTRDTFKVSIPYIDFKKESRGNRPYILDTSVLIDGRIIDLVKTNFITSPLIVPHLAVKELQERVNHSDKPESLQGKRGLEKLKILREFPEVRIDESYSQTDVPREQWLAQIVQTNDGVLVTTDNNLHQVLSLQDISVLNINEIATALRPIYLAGDHLQITLTKSGESPGQGVGYLSDGTMVVVEQGDSKLGKNITVEVTSSLQTNAGHLVFARFDE